MSHPNGPEEVHRWSFAARVERWQYLNGLRTREYLGRSFLHGEDAARVWLAEQPPIELEPDGRPE